MGSEIVLYNLRHIYLREIENYQSISMQNVNPCVVVNKNPDLPQHQGTVANVKGFIEYSGGFTGNFTATLEKS
jgi:hypothetical protein